jgi:hypothetical protein
MRRKLSIHGAVSHSPCLLQAFPQKKVHLDDPPRADGLSVLRTDHQHKSQDLCTTSPREGFPHVCMLLRDHGTVQFKMKESSKKGVLHNLLLPLWSMTFKNKAVQMDINILSQQLLSFGLVMNPSIS